MRKAWKIVKEKYPGLIVNGCAAHTINLLVKDICKLEEYATVLQQARDITAFVKDRNVLTKRFERIQTSLLEDGDLDKKLTLVYVGETRWYTHHSCVRGVLYNKKVLKQIVETTVFANIKATKKVKPKKEKFMALIRDDAFWEKLELIELTLRPTSVIVGILEADACCLSDIYRIFLALIQGFSSHPKILELIQDRWAFLHTESMGFAYFLDPKTRAGEGFIENDLYDNAILLKEFVLKKQFTDDDGTFQNEYERFLLEMKNPPTRAVEYINSHSAIAYWLTVGSTKFPILYKVAEIVFRVPTSQAAAERAHLRFYLDQAPEQSIRRKSNQTGATIHEF